MNLILGFDNRKAPTTFKVLPVACNTSLRELVFWNPHDYMAFMNRDAS